MCGLPLTLLGRWSLLAGGSSGCGGPYPVGCEVIEGWGCGALLKFDRDGEVAVGDARGLPWAKSPRTCGGIEPLPM